MLIMLLLILLVGAAAVFAMPYMTYNRLMALDEQCDKAFADIDVQLKQRHDLIPPLVETVRGFASHEQNAIAAVTEARAAALRASGADNRLEAETQLGQSINTLLSVVENYPELRASDHFRDLRMELSDAENRIAAARRFYNLAVAEYNSTLRQFPGNLVAARANLSRRRAFDLGVERVLLDEPAAVKF